MKKLNNRRFFTFEVIIVIVIIGILLYIAVPKIIGFINTSRIAVDRTNIKTLNTTTSLYSIKYKKIGLDAFEGFFTDEERMDELVDKGFLIYTPTPQLRGAEFIWHVNSQKWLYDVLIIVENSLSEFEFSNMLKSDFLFNSWGGGCGSTWSINEDGLSVTGGNGNDLLFIGNDKSEYTLTTKFKLNENPDDSGGLGIFFETILNGGNNNRDTGYILQLDRDFSEIVLRRRVDGNESNSEDMLLERIGNRTSSTIENKNIPYKIDSEWWEAEKELSISVKESETPGVKLITVLLDNEVILSDYQIESDIQAPNNHTGFRSWNNQPATIYDLVVED